MKANGRRRFRKMNARFRQRGSEVVSERARTTSAGKARKLILNDFWGGDPLPLPPRPFSPRSLVGMTQRARKRAAWKSFSERARYHIGQRLRPCPGCLRCRSCVGCEVLTFEGDTCEDCGRETPMATESCDGSGVLPARRAKS
jgi:hypothetical protein